MAKTYQIERPDLGAEVQRRLAKGGSRREMERLMALRLDLGEEHALEQIGQEVGRARSRIIERMRLAHEHGVQSCWAGIRDADVRRG